MNYGLYDDSNANYDIKITILQPHPDRAHVYNLGFFLCQSGQDFMKPKVVMQKVKCES